MSAMSSQPLHISAVTRLGRAEWLPLSASPPWGKKTHILITTGSLVMAPFECIPTCDWGGETGGGMCEISV